MKKAVLSLLALVALAAAAWIFLPGMIGRSLVRSEADAAGIPFTVGDVSFNPFGGTARLRNVVLQSEDPFSAPHVVRIRQIDARFDASTMLSPFIVVKSVTVSGVDVNVEQSGRRLNVRELATRFEAYLATADTTSQPRVFVEEFRIETASGTLLTDAGERSFEMAEIVMRDLGSDTNGTPVHVLAANVLDPLLERALTSAGISGGIGGGLRSRLGRLFGSD